MEKKNHTLDYIKRQAKKLKKEQGITHTQALEIVSKNLGYSNWMNCQRSIGKNRAGNIVAKKAEDRQQPSFTDWIKKHTKRNSPLGDLAKDVVDDPNWPNLDTKEGYLKYLNFMGASTGAIEALKRSWRSYKSYLKNLSSPKIKKPIHQANKPLNADVRKIVFVKNVKPIPFPNRTTEKFSVGDKAWISWNGSKAIPVTVVEVLDEHYSVQIERPQKKAGSINSLFADEVRSTPELACLNHVTF